MREGPVNRLETHWPQSALPEGVAFSPPTISDRAQHWEAELESFLAEHPKLTVAAAATFGLILGWMVKRR